LERYRFLGEGRVRNDHNGGIYVIRHMEEYKGVSSHWDIEMKKNEVSILYAFL